MLQKNHKIISVLISVAFVIIIQALAYSNPVFRYLISAFLGYLIGLTIYNVIYLRANKRYNIWTLLRPILFLLSWFGLIFILPSLVLRELFLLLSLPLVYILEARLTEVNAHFLFNEVLITAFGFFMSIVAFSWYFLLPGAVYLLTIFVFITLLVRSSYEFTPKSLRTKWAGALCLGLFVAELFWALLFLPLHYSAIALILLNAFYFGWALYYYDLFNLLTKKKLQFHLALALLLIGVTFMMTPWEVLK